MTIRQRRHVASTRRAGVARKTRPIRKLRARPFARKFPLALPLYGSAHQRHHQHRCTPPASPRGHTGAGEGTDGEAGMDGRARDSSASAALTPLGIRSRADHWYTFSPSRAICSAAVSCFSF